MKLVEIVRGVETDAALVPVMHGLSEAWGKTSVDAPNAPGFIVNRVARPYYAEGLRLLAERIASAAGIDRLMREAGGFAMGPFELMDLIGVEVNLSVTESVFQATAFDPRFAPSLLQQELVRSGRFGRKTGQGFHRYGADAPVLQVEAVTPVPAAPVIGCAARMGLLAPLMERLRSSGVAVQLDAALPDETFTVDGVRVTLTDGRTATERAATEGTGPVLLLDLARDFATTALLGAAASVGAHGRLAELAAVLQGAGIDLLALDDVAGLALMRTVCCLANEAADVITWSGATARDIDVAMRLGTAYPVGPLAWADTLGAARVATVLRHLQEHYGDVRYRRSPLLTRLQHARGTFHS
jgi:3-hydroxybutyryl-CoA dehydrogenase